MSSTRYRNAAAAGTVVLAVAALGAGSRGLYPQAFLFGIGVLILGEAGVREHQRARRLEDERAWVRRRHTLYCPHPGPLTPCCRLAQASHDAAHDARCTRPGQPGPPADLAFLADHRDRFERLVADLPIPDPRFTDPHTTGTHQEGEHLQ